MSNAKPSRAYRPTEPPYVPDRSYTVTRCPATASRAAAAIAPIPAPITAIRAMSVTLTATADKSAGRPVRTRPGQAFLLAPLGLRRRNRRIREARKASITMPSTSSVAAMIAAASGWNIANVMIPATPRSSAVLTAILLKGSGEVFTAILVPAFTRWLISAVEPPTAPAASSGSEPL